MLSKSRMIFVLLLFFSFGVRAQFYEYGQDPGRLRWGQFRTENYRFIFPLEADSLARAYALRAEHYYEHLGKPLDHAHSTMPVILHNQTSFSNGVFVWAPKRLEIFSNPDPADYGVDWLTGLALHEGRHAVQIDKLNQGFTRGFSLLGGQQISGLMAVFLPNWYLEGDAVDAETRLSKAGRGRLPSFEMQHKAQLLEEEELHPYSKAYLGSYRDFVPNHYRLGYLMVRHGRRTHGDDIWIDYQLNAARKPFLLNPGWFTLRNYGYRNKSAFYREALNAYGDHWKSMADERKLSQVRYHSPDPGKHYTSYQYPMALPDGRLLAYKSGMDQIPEFVLVDSTGRESRLHRPGYLNTGRCTLSDSLLCWDEFVADTRWSNRNFSVIHLLDLRTGEHRRIGRRSRYYSPALSGDASRLAAIEQKTDGRSNLLLIGTRSASVTRITAPQEGQLQQPAWMERDTALVVMLNGQGGKELYRYSLTRNNWEKLFSAGFEQISDPCVRGDSIIFSASFSGIDNIYCYVASLDEVFQLSSAAFGAFQPSLSADARTLYFASYHSRGHRLASLPLEEALWKPLEAARDDREQLDHDLGPGLEVAGFNTLAEGGLDSLPVTRRYSKPLNLFNFHSWLPLYFDYLNPRLSLDPENLPFSPGLTLLSQNLLSTAITQIAYEYKDGYHHLHTGLQLKGRYPVLNLYVDYGGLPEVADMDSLTRVTDLNLQVESYIPFRLNTGKYLSLVQPGLSWSFDRLAPSAEAGAAEPWGMQVFTPSLYATSYLRPGLRDIWPRLGVVLSGLYSFSPFNEDIGFFSSIRGSIYLPGILRHHSIKLGLNYQLQGIAESVRFGSLPRGLDYIVSEEARMLSFDYVLPLLYPDLALGPFIYLKRIRMGLWTDYMEAENVYEYDGAWRPFNQRDYHTLGSDLLFDFNALRIPFELSAGGRFHYDLLRGGWGVELLMSVDLP